MTTALWTWGSLIGLTGGRGDGAPTAPITSVSIDTRTIGPGDLFVALKDQRDGHDFVTAAFKAGAAAALVGEHYTRRDGDGALLRVEDPLRALEDMGRVARFRGKPRVAAITGSVGKTGTKEMLRACLGAVGSVHASEKSYNNHWGVPLTLAKLPAATQFGVFEIGMNHAGEITPLVRMVAPEIAVITTVEPVHLGFFASEDEIADAKAEIFLGLEPGGTAVLNRDNRHFDRLTIKAEAAGAKVVSFGTVAGSDVRAVDMDVSGKGTAVTVQVGGRTARYTVGAPGRHIAMNSLAVVAVLQHFGLDLEAGLKPLADVAAPVGRGARRVIRLAGGEVLLIDESYNANPASMRAALATLGTVPRADFPRRIAVLGDMRELGEQGAQLHRDLKAPIDDADIDLVLACGPLMRHLVDTLQGERVGGWAEKSVDLVAPLKAALRPGDVVVIKGSLGTNMAPLIKAVQDLGQGIGSTT
jgi:UDP-N-acetylmuramoyl-tripeptide--D-alanyl-D-alanine ligase